MSGDLEFYGTVDGADSYHTARANTDWTDEPSSPPDAKVAALLRATQYIDGYYRTRFPGRKTAGRAQALEWPRINARDIDGNELADDEIPVEVVHATYEAALRELVSPGILAPDQAATLGAVRRQREKVGPLEEETEFFEGGASTDPLFRRIDQLLSGLVAARSNINTALVLRA